ncbi:MAG: transcriptional repressor [Planctomycetota bacterium]
MAGNTDGTISAQEAIRAAGLRATPARVATLLVLRRSAAPLTHAEVSAELAEAAIDKATVFRSLSALVDAGLSRRFEVGDHVYRFEQVVPGEAATHRHPHFLCTVCGVVSCLDHAGVSSGIRRVCETIGDVTDIVLRGRCRECQ